MYKILPFKREFYCVLRRLWRPPQSVYQHLHFTGPFNVALNDEGFFLNHRGTSVENAIFWTGLAGDFESVSLSVWQKLARDAGVVLDVGAATGLYALAAKAANPHAEVYAFEPVCRIFEDLLENCAINSYDIHCSRSAVSNFDGKMKLYDPMTDNAWGVTTNRSLFPADAPLAEIEVDVVTLASLLRAPDGPSRINLMTINVQTHEAEVLEGMGEFLEKFRPAILIEILTPEVARRVEPLVAGKGYLYFSIDEKNPPKRQKHITRNEYRNHLLCGERDAKRLGLL